MSSGKVHSGSTIPTEATACLVIYFLKAEYCQIERDILVPPNRNDWIGQNRSPSEVVPNIPVGPNRNGPFHLISYHNFRSFLLNGKRPRFGRQYTVCISCFIFVVSLFFTKYKTTLRKRVLVDTSRVMILLTSRKRLRIKNSKTIDSPVNHRPRRKRFPKNETNK